MGEFAIQTQELTKTFPGGVEAVIDLDLQIERGAVYGLMGRNGAGKTTTLRLLMGLLRPDRGRARMLGADFWRAPRTVRARVAYVSQALQLPAWMTLAELCRYAEHFYEEWDRDLARDLAKRWDLAGHRRLGELSGGEQRKAAILLALAPRPEVLLLDEPAAGLDPISRRELVDALISVVARGDGCTILFSTHILSDLERVAEYVGIMDHGHLMMSARLDELQANTRRVQVIFPGEAPPNGFHVPGALRQEVAGPVVRAITRAPDLQFLEAWRMVPGVRIQMFPLGLEDIFIEMLGQGVREEMSGREPSEENEPVDG